MTILDAASIDDVTQRDWQHTEDGSVRFAVIALGWFSRDHAIPALLDSDLCDVSVTVSGSKQKAETVAAEIDAEYALTYEEYHDGKGADAYDAIYLVTPNALHLEYVETAARLSKAVLCEKPMEGTFDRAEQIVDVCDRHNVDLMIAYRMQTEPAVRRAKELVQQGVIGDIVQIHGSMTHRLLELIPDPDQWRLDPALSGGGAMMDIGIYPLNTTRFLLDSTPERIYANTYRGDSPFDKVDERVTFELEFTDGVTASCLASHNANQGSHLTLLGTDGKITLENPFFPWQQCSLHVERGENTVHLTFEQVNQLTEEFDYFADRVLTGHDIYPNGEHGLTDMRIIGAIYESAQTGTQIQL
jgi:xylose dehydrogenase (NAD/NADP)